MKLTEKQINFLKQHWKIEGEPQFHRRLANFVYFTHQEGQEVVLRLTEPFHRKSHEIESELHWMNYLTTHGMRIAKPIYTVNQQLTVELPGEKIYFAALFEKARGAFLKDDEDVSDEMIEAWGQYIGKMHRLTQAYKPAVDVQRRQQWEQDESLAMALRSLDKDDSIPYTKMNELLEWMRLLPQTSDSYGLIHSDLHPDKKRTLEKFLNGYIKENKLDRIWIERIKLFDKYRAALTYHWIKTFTKEGVFDAKGLEWAKQKAPELLAILREPLNLF